MEPVEKIASNSLFKADVIIKCKKEALEEARKDRTGLVLWTDGSKLDQGHIAAAVCWKDETDGQWKEKSMFLGKNKEILGAELWAISEALDIAKKTINMGGRWLSCYSNIYHFTHLPHTRPQP